jgi:hypothetical protein
LLCVNVPLVFKLLGLIAEGEEGRHGGDDREDGQDTLLAAMTRPARTRGGHEPASGSHRSCTSSTLLASPVAGAWLSVPRWGEEAVSYQQPPEQRAGTPTGPPHGWYLDPLLTREAAL